MKNIMDEYVAFVKKYIDVRLTQGFIKNDLLNICVGMDRVLLEWTGNTYVGRRKEKETEQWYQKFFVSIHDFLKFCADNSHELSEMERSIAEKMMYRGSVYRYLGKCDSRNIRKKEIVYPEYNDVFVSWSKSETNYYILSKLYGPRTWMKAEIKEPYFGIDIHGFELWCREWFGDSSFITRGEEKEVVFPTIKELSVEF